MSILSENLKLLHQESGLSFEELSIRTGINESIIKAFENEQLEPNEYQLEILCRVLRFPYEDIYDRNLVEERKAATRKMRSNTTREQYNWYFGDRKVFWYYLSYIIFFVVMIIPFFHIVVNSFFNNFSQNFQCLGYYFGNKRIRCYFAAKIVFVL